MWLAGKYFGFYVLLSVVQEIFIQPLRRILVSYYQGPLMFWGILSKLSGNFIGAAHLAHAPMIRVEMVAILYKLRYEVVSVISCVLEAAKNPHRKYH